MNIFSINWKVFLVSFAIMISIFIVIEALQFLKNGGKIRKWVVIGNTKGSYNKKYGRYLSRIVWKSFLYRGFSHTFNRLKGKNIEILEVVELMYGQEKDKYKDRYRPTGISENDGAIINVDKEATNAILSNIKQYNDCKNNEEMKR